MSDAHQKGITLKVVASNSTLKAGRARLNLKTAFALLSKGRPASHWLPTINDLRTCLAKDPLPLETVKELLASA